MRRTERKVCITLMCRCQCNGHGDTCDPSTGGYCSCILQNNTSPTVFQPNYAYQVGLSEFSFECLMNSNMLVFVGGLLIGIGKVCLLQCEVLAIGLCCKLSTL